MGGGRTLAAAALLATLLAGGCGGEEDEDRFPALVAGPLSKTEFLREADRICFASEARIEAAADDLARRRGGPSAAAVGRLAERVVIPALETEVDAIRALGAPEGDEREVEAILDATAAGIESIRARPRALLDGVPAPLRRAQRLAEAYGSRECGFR